MMALKEKSTLGKSFKDITKISIIFKKLLITSILHGAEIIQYIDKETGNIQANPKEYGKDILLRPHCL